MADNFQTVLDTSLEFLIKASLEKNELIKAYHLIKAGANPNIQNKKGYTILLPVINYGDLGLLKDFVEAGCDIQHKDISGEKPIDYAINNQFVDITEWLLDNGVDVNEVLSNRSASWDTYKRIHYICCHPLGEEDLTKSKNNMKNIAEIFIKKGANLLEEDNSHYGNLPIDWAMINNSADHPFVKYIRDETNKQAKLASISIKELIIETIPQTRNDDEVKESRTICLTGYEAKIRSESLNYIECKKELSKEIECLKEEKERLEKDVKQIKSVLDKIHEKIISFNNSSE